MYDLQRWIFGEAYRLECAHGTMNTLQAIGWSVSMVP